MNLAKWSMRSWAGHRECMQAGFRPGDIAINTFSYHMVPFALQMVDNSLHQDRMYHDPHRGRKYRTAGQYLEESESKRLLRNAQFSSQHRRKGRRDGTGSKKGSQPPVGFVAAEMLPESLRSKLEEKFGMIIRQSYGTADIGCLGYECMEKNGMHIPDDKIVEIVDPKHRETAGARKDGRNRRHHLQ